MKLLEHATQYNNSEVIEFIKGVKEFGGNILPKDNNGTPMHHAADSGNIALIKKLYIEKVRI